jgi:hypothetical protein
VGAERGAQRSTLAEVGHPQEEREKSMSLHIMLVDLENVPRFSISDVPVDSTVHVIMNATQLKKALSLVEDAKRLGLPPVQCYVIHTSGPNAADFVLSCKLGELASANPHAEYVIVSNDSGFDALVAYLVAKGVNCYRMAYPQPGGASKAKRRSSSKSVKKSHAKSDTCQLPAGASNGNELLPTKLGEGAPTAPSPTGSHTDNPSNLSLGHLGGEDGHKFEELYRLVVRRLWQRSQSSEIGSGLPKTKQKLAQFLANCINGDPLLRQAKIVEQIIGRLIEDGYVHVQKDCVTRLIYQFPKLTTGQSQGTKQQPSVEHQLV